MTKQARFWIMAPNGGGNVVRIKLDPGQSASHCAAWSTDEGWSSEAHVWSFDGEVVRVTYSTDGVDCDGRMQTFGEAECPLAELAAGYAYAGVAFPIWQRTFSRQRDHSAEAMGY